jgi:hypothetical protein
MALICNAFNHKVVVSTLNQISSHAVIAIAC